MLKQKHWFELVGLIFNDFELSCCTSLCFVHQLHPEFVLCFFSLAKCKITHFIHWPQSQRLFRWHWGHGTRAPADQTIIIWAGSKKSHMPQFMSAVIAWRNGWFRIWNKLRNHFLCTALIHLSPDTQTFRACFLSNWHGRQVSNIQTSRKGFFFFFKDTFKCNLCPCWHDCNRLNWLTATFQCHDEDTHKDIKSIFRHINVLTSQNLQFVTPKETLLLVSWNLPSQEPIKRPVKCWGPEEPLLGWLRPRGWPEDMSDLRIFTALLAEENTSPPNPFANICSQFDLCIPAVLLFNIHRGYDLPGQRWKGTAGRENWFVPYFGPGSRQGEEKSEARG